MKWLISLLIALGLAVVIALNARVDSGYVMLSYGKWSAEMSGLLLGLMLVAAFSILYVGIRFLAGVKHIPGRTQNWRAHRKQIKGNDGLTKGLLRLIEGRWVEAEKILLKQLKNSHAPLLNYLAAARAAQKMGKFQKRDNHLNIALNNFPADKIAIEITRSELLLEQGHCEQAVELLRSLRYDAPKNLRVMSLLAKVYKQLEDWESLKDLLPVIRKQMAMSDDELYPLTTECHLELLKKAGEAEDVGELLKAWSQVPKEHRTYKNILMIYSKLLMDKNRSDLLESLLKNAINNKWDTDLVYIYGKLTETNAIRQISTAESWLMKHEKDPTLLLTLGRLNLRCELWGKAREYLSLSISYGGSAEACYILAQLLERMDETDTAAKYYQQGLSMSVNANPFELPKVAIAQENNTPPRLTLDGSIHSERLILEKSSNQHRLAAVESQNAQRLTFISH